eukprot:s1370_g12.t1
MREGGRARETKTENVPFLEERTICTKGREESFAEPKATRKGDFQLGIVARLCHRLRPGAYDLCYQLQSQGAPQRGFARAAAVSLSNSIVFFVRCLMPHPELPSAAVAKPQCTRASLGPSSGLQLGTSKALRKCDDHLAALATELRKLHDMLEAPRTENEELASSGKMEPLCSESSESESGSEAQGDGCKEVQPHPVLHKKALKTSQQVRRAPLLLRPLQPSASVLDPKRISGQSGQGSGASGFIAKLLEFGPPIVILLNAITIALDSDVIENDSILRLVESCFAMFYLLEFMIKLGLLGCRGYFWAENWTWNWFDFLCLLCALLELSAVLVSVLGFTSTPFLEDVTVVRVFRLGQLMRTVRVLNFKMFGELRQITLGIMNGCGVLFWAVVLLFGVIYVFGVVMRNLVGDAMEEFKNIPNSMFTLFRCFTDGCSDYAGTPLAERLRIVYGAPFTLGYVCVTMLVAVGIFNMIMAIFLENATASAGRRKQRELGERANSTERALRRVIAALTAYVCCVSVIAETKVGFGEEKNGKATTATAAPVLTKPGSVKFLSGFNYE